MNAEMRRSLARLPYEEKLRSVAELIEFSRRLKAAASHKNIGRYLRSAALIFATATGINDPSVTARFARHKSENLRHPFRLRLRLAR